MDIPRDTPKNRRRYVYVAIAIVAVLGVTLALSKMGPALPSVEGATQWIDTVRRGEMLRQVRGPGTLVPEQIQYISAVTAGRIEQLPLRPPAPVTANSIIMEMSNPDVQLQLLEAQRQLTASEADLVTLRKNLATEQLTTSSAVATTQSDYNDAMRQALVSDSLGAKKLLSPNEVQKAKDKAKELSQRIKDDQARLTVMQHSAEDQVKLQEQQIARLKNIVEFQQSRLNSMHVRAGSDGVLQELPWELGQWVNSGSILAKVAQPGKLKAQLRIPETQAKDITVGQRASIDTRNGIIPGHVIRVDPSAQNGTVGVDVALDGALPKGARPDLSVDGTVEIERLDNVMYVQRPAYGQAESTVGMFRVTPDKKTAQRVSVKLGASSVNTIVVLQGLNVGDLVIVSDMSAYDSYDKVRLKW